MNPGHEPPDFSARVMARECRMMTVQCKIHLNPLICSQIVTKGHELK